MKLNLNAYLLTGVFAVLFALSSCKKDNRNDIVPLHDAAPQSNQRVQAVTPATFKVVAYLPTWEGDVNAVQYSKLTHIIYAFLTPRTDGGLNAIENPGKFTSMISLAHNNNVKALIAVGGGGGGDAFHTIVASASLRTTFVNNMVTYVNQNNADGVDIDWEFPSAGTEANNFALMMQQLANAMHGIGKLCTAAVISTGATYVTSTTINSVDWLNVMDYDDNNFQHSTYQSAVDCLNYWSGRGLPLEKTVLGVPFYARDNRFDYSTKNYNDVLAIGGSPNADTFQNFGYNGIPTIKAKTNLVFDRGIAGLMIWELAGDATGANSLLSAINQTILSHGSGNPTTPPIGQTVTLKGFNNQYASGENGTQAMRCNRPTAGTWETYTVIDAGGGKIALRSMGKYVSSENGTQAITCNRTAISDTEKFDWVPTADGKVTFRGNNGKFISSENGTQAMTCTRVTAQGWEAFAINQ
jgi:chitinase